MTLRRPSLNPETMQLLVNALRLSPSGKAIAAVQHEEAQGSHVIVARHWVENPERDYDEHYWIEVAHVNSSYPDAFAYAHISGIWDELDTQEPNTPIWQYLEKEHVPPYEMIWLPLEVLYL